MQIHITHDALREIIAEMRSAADETSSDASRTHVKKAFGIAMQGLTVVAAGNFAKVIGKTINAASDFMPVPALIGAIMKSIYDGPQQAAEKIVEALTNPAGCACPNPRSKTGFGYGHHKDWGSSTSAVQCLDALKYVADQCGVTINVATKQGESMDINHIAVVANALAVQLATYNSLTIQPSAEEVAAQVEKAAGLCAQHYKLDESGFKAVVSAVEVVNMARDISETIDEGIKYANDPVVRAIVETVLPAETAKGGSSNDPAPSQDEPVKTITLDPNLAPAVNALLSQASKGEITDAVATLSELATLRAKAANLANELARANARPVIAVTNGEQQVDGSTLTYEVVMRNCADLFRNPKTGRAMPQLKFEVPTLVWKDNTGAVVNHPMVPAIDDNYQFRMTHILKLATAFLMNKNVWAHGHTGTGKTTLIEQFYARLGFPAFRVNLDSNLERADLVGQKDLANENGTTVTTFVEGILPQAMTQPCVLILDEIDAGRPDILFVIQRATEGNGLLLTEDGGRLVRPHPLFRFCATANSRGQGDEFGVYAGVRPMNTAMLDRFGVMIEVDYLKEDEEEMFVARAYPSLAKDVGKQIVIFAKLIREAFRNGEISMTLSPRGVKSLVELYSFYEGVLPTKTAAMEMAVEMVVVDRATTDNRQRVLELRERAFK